LPLEPLLPLFHQLNREHFEGSLVRDNRPLVALRWSDGRLTRTAGLYRRWSSGAEVLRSEILLSRPLLDPLPRSATLSTLCHEMIHAWVDRVLGAREAHGPNFRARMALINSRQPGFEVSLRHRFPVPARRARWLARCPRCGLRSPYQRRREGLACRLCCERFHGGHWHADCLLVFEPLTP
jgi:hypothetical protein